MEKFGEVPVKGDFVFAGKEFLGKFLLGKAKKRKKKQRPKQRKLQPKRRYFRKKKLLKRYYKGFWGCLNKSICKYMN
jgi:hypothetical protein